MPTYETGHARNISNFESLISFVTAYDLAYAPSNPAIELTALTSKLAAAKSSLALVTAKLAASKGVVNDREAAFKPLKKLATRIVNNYASTGVAENYIADANSIKRKIAGTRAKPVPVTDTGGTGNGTNGNGTDVPATNSASQQSFVQLVAHFDNLVGYVGNDPLYAPEEDDLKITALNTYSDLLKTNNQAVITNYSALNNARLDRDQAMYGEGAGLVDIAMLVKRYVKALFGAASPQYKQISGLQFRRQHQK